MRTCSVSECKNKHYAKGYCNKHYQQERYCNKKNPFKSNLIKGDVIEQINSHPEWKEFDLVIADPPYNIGKDFGNDSDSRSYDEYNDWMCNWINLCRDRLAKTGILYIYGYPENLAPISARYSIHEQRWLVWHYRNKSTASKSNFWQRSHESILCLWKRESNTLPSLEIDQIRVPYTDAYLTNVGKERKSTPSLFADKGKKTKYKAHPNGAMPRDVIEIPALAGGSDARERAFICRTCNDK